LFLSRKTTITGTIRTTFLRKVCQLVSLMASPKHPQSDTGLVESKNQGKESKKRHKKKTAQEAIFILSPSSRAIPIINRQMPEERRKEGKNSKKPR
jgi:hypothetical protein